MSNNGVVKLLEHSGWSELSMGERLAETLYTRNSSGWQYTDLYCCNIETSLVVTPAVMHCPQAVSQCNVLYRVSFVRRCSGTTSPMFH